MENASKALIIAGSILIAMIVLSVLVWGWNRVARYHQTEEEIETVQQIFQKNKELESYNKQIVRGYELRSLYNLIIDMNTRYSEEKGYKNISAKIRINKDSEIMNFFKVIFNVNDSRKGQSNKNKLDEITRRWVTSKDGDSLEEFMESYFLKEEGLRKIFNETYFKCIDMKYNGELEDEEGNGTGRVQSFVFEQI